MAACLALVWFARRSPMTPDRPIASQQTSPAQMRCGELRLPSDIEVLCLEAGTVLRVTEMRAEAVSVTLDRGEARGSMSTKVTHRGRPSM